MRKRGIVISGVMLLIGSGTIPALAAAAAEAAAKAASPSPREVLDRVDDLYRGKSSHGKVTMKVVTQHWTREMDLEYWSLGKEKSLIRILAPIKDKDTATLRSGDNMWNYLPKVNRVIKIPSSMMGGSWMGSHFTNDDLVKESRMADDYDFEVSFEGDRDGARVVEITCTPKPDAAVVWGKVGVRVRRADLMPLSIEYFDEDGKLSRTLSFSELKEMGGRLLPTVERMVPVDKPGELTEIVYRDIVFDVDLEDDLFSLRSLQR